MFARKGLYALALLAMLACTPAFAGSWATSGYTGLGFLDEDEFDDDAFASSLSLVYRWSDNFGIEGGYTRLGDFKNDFNTVGGRAQARAELDGFTLGMHFLNDLNERWYVSARAGVWFWDAESRLEIPGTAAVRFDDDGTDLYAGAALGYKFTERFGAGVGVTYFSAEVGGSDTGVYIAGVHTMVRF